MRPTPEPGSRASRDRNDTERSRLDSPDRVDAPSALSTSAGDSAEIPVRQVGPPRRVFDAWNAAHDQPCRLTPARGRAEVYVNPATVTFWIE